MSSCLQTQKAITLRKTGIRSLADSGRWLMLGNLPVPPPLALVRAEDKALHAFPEGARIRGRSVVLSPDAKETIRRAVVAARPMAELFRAARPV
jgi:hypothetical protein